jgi:hypothetical protein
MSKKILAIYFTQSGQLTEIVDAFCKPIQQSGISTEIVVITPKDPFPFPWTSDRFFDAMPESVLGIPVELNPFFFKEQSYDLILFAYQPWYLSPSIPATSILKHPEIMKIMAHAPVITIIGSRNMWLNAQEKVKLLLKNAQANLIGNIALADKHNNQLSAISIVHWMLSGKKDRYLGIFPKPGISEKDIQHTEVFGTIVLNYLQKGDWNGLQTELISNKAVEIKANLMFIEGRAGRLFSIWANLIRNSKNRKVLVYVFKYYLAIALFVVAPIVVVINEIFFQPFVDKQIKNKIKYYSGLN